MKAHRTDVVSFAFGLVFLGLSVWWLLARILGLTLPPVGWFLAGGLILIGLLGLVGALRSGRHADSGPVHQRPEATAASSYLETAPTGGAPTAPEADEWATDAVADWPVQAREDRPGGGEPHWSPTTPPGDPGDLATRELPAVEPAAGGGPGESAPVTRELPAVDGPEQPGGRGASAGPGADGATADRSERPPS
ncbi:hypothetical protein [Micromonospora sp. NPDC047740]|uniref:hypothetical protein n=1 Tax=Micromonospora sp. NPDC047740 TaxID=3364254 RepID=UPI003720E827